MYRWENDLTIWPVSGTLTPFSRHYCGAICQYGSSGYLHEQTTRLAIDKITVMKILRLTVGFIDLFDFEPAHMRAGVGILIGDKESRRQGLAAEVTGTTVHVCI